MWEWVLQNSGWLVPLILLVGNEIVKRTSTTVDNDIWKIVSYILEKIFGTVNKSTKGKNYSVYQKEEDKPKVARLTDKVVDGLKSKIKINFESKKIK